MNDKQNASLNMFQAASNVLEANRSKYAAIPVLQNAADKLKGNIGLIRETDKGRTETKVKASSADKQAAAEVMIDNAVTTARITNVYAFDTGNQALMMQTNATKSQFYKLQDNAALALAKTIYEKAAEHREEVLDYGLSEEMLEDLDKSIGGFEAVIVKPRDTTTERKEQTKTLAQLFAETKSLLYDRTDKLMAQFKASDPAFYGTYFEARNTINSAYRRKDTDKKE